MLHYLSFFQPTSSCLIYYVTCYRVVIAFSGVTHFNRRNANTRTRFWKEWNLVNILVVNWLRLKILSLIQSIGASTVPILASKIYCAEDATANDQENGDTKENV